jgi:hypothetical protein
MDLLVRYYHRKQPLIILLNNEYSIDLIIKINQQKKICHGIKRIIIEEYLEYVDFNDFEWLLLIKRMLKQMDDYRNDHIGCLNNCNCICKSISVMGRSGSNSIGSGIGSGIESGIGSGIKSSAESSGIKSSGIESSSTESNGIKSGIESSSTESNGTESSAESSGIKSSAESSGIKSSSTESNGIKSSTESSSIKSSRIKSSGIESSGITSSAESSGIDECQDQKNLNEKLLDFLSLNHHILLDLINYPNRSIKKKVLQINYILISKLPNLNHKSINFPTKYNKKCEFITNSITDRNCIKLMILTAIKLKNDVLSSRITMEFLIDLFSDHDSSIFELLIAFNKFELFIKLLESIGYCHLVFLDMIMNSIKGLEYLIMIKDTKVNGNQELMEFLYKLYLVTSKSIEYSRLSRLIEKLYMNFGFGNINE